MSGVCSAHLPEVTDPDCPACNATPAQLLGVTEEEWDRKVAEAEEAGLHDCEGCGFTYYLTTDMCPLCRLVREDLD